MCFIAPAFLIVLACAGAYTRYGTFPAAEGLLRGIKPVIVGRPCGVWGGLRPAREGSRLDAASIALMALVTAQLARAAIVDPWTAGVAAVSAVLLLRFRASPAWLVPAAALLGLVLPR